MSMKSKMLGLSAILLASQAINIENNYIHSELTKTSNIDPEWKRKKCKSCIHLPTKYCKCYVGNKYVNPKSQACNKYLKSK